MTSHPDAIEGQLASDGSIAPTMSETGLDQIICLSLWQLDNYVSALLARPGANIQEDHARLLRYADSVRDLATKLPAPSKDQSSSHGDVFRNGSSQYHSGHTPSGILPAQVYMARAILGDGRYSTGQSSDQTVSANVHSIHGLDTNNVCVQPAEGVENHHLDTFAGSGIDFCGPQASISAAFDEISAALYSSSELSMHVAPAPKGVALRMYPSRVTTQSENVSQAHDARHRDHCRSVSVHRLIRHKDVAEILLAVVGDEESLSMAGKLSTQLNGSCWTDFVPSELDFLGVCTQLVSLTEQQYQVAIKRRMILLRLQDCFQSLCTALKSSPLRTGGKVESQVLDQLVEMVKSTPHAMGIINAPRHSKDPESRIRKSLSNQLQASKHWAMARERFDIGIIALFPVGRDIIANTAFETLPEQITQQLFDAIAKNDAARGSVLRDLLPSLTRLLGNIYASRPPESLPQSPDEGQL